MNLKKIDDNTYWVDVRVTKEGRVFRQRKKIQGSRRAAEHAYNTIYADLQERAKTFIATGSTDLSLQRFGECIDYYLKRKTPDERSLHYFERLKQELGNTELKALHEKFDNFLYDLKSEKTYKGTVYSDASRNRFLSWAKTAINFCIKSKKINCENPIAHIGKQKETPRDVILDKEEKEKLLSVLESEYPELYPLVFFAIQVPCRLSELTGAGRECFDEINNIIRIKNGKTKNGQGICKPVPPSMIDYFKQIPKESAWLFYRIEKGEYKQFKSFRVAFRSALQKAGIKKQIKFHDLRHIAATQMLLDGNPERVIMEFAGWKTNMLSTYYHRGGLEIAKKAIFSDVNKKVDMSVYQINGI